MRIRFTGKPWVVRAKWIAAAISTFGAIYAGWNFPYRINVAETCGALTAFIMWAIGFSKPEEVDNNDMVN